MKRSIKKTMYNTETAKNLGHVSGGRGDMRYSETMYMTRKGQHFLHGKGGIATRWEGREAIHAVSDLTFKLWMMRFDKKG